MTQNVHILFLRNFPLYGFLENFGQCSKKFSWQVFPDNSISLQNPYPLSVVFLEFLLDAWATFSVSTVPFANKTAKLCVTQLQSKQNLHKCSKHVLCVHFFQEEILYFRRSFHYATALHFQTRFRRVNKQSPVTWIMFKTSEILHNRNITIDQII